MNRRMFMGTAAAAVGATLTGRLSRVLGEAGAAGTRPASGPIIRATDTVTLGKTGIKPSRLAIGMGTKVSKQRELGERGIVKLLRHGLDQGVRWWDSADMYGIHPYLGVALKQIQREQVVITSKTMAKDATGVQADVERFRKELGTDYIDIVLLHCLTDPGWPETMKGPMDALSEAKSKGYVRAVGCSCHVFGALEAAANTPWVEVDLARINPFAVIMDVGKPDEVPKVVGVLQTMHERGKSVYGMKILGEDRFKGEQIDTSLQFALSQRYLSGFVIGFRAPEEIDDIIRRIDRLGVRA